MSNGHFILIIPDVIILGITSAIVLILYGLECFAKWLAKYVENKKNRNHGAKSS